MSRDKVFLSVGASFLLGSVFVVFLFAPALSSAQSVAPKISDITITSITATTTVVTWETDIEADSEVNYGLDKNYGIARDPFPDKKKHSVTISDLLPSTIYHLRVGSSDAYGNQALSGDYVIATKSSLDVKDIKKVSVDDRPAVERAVAAIQEIQTAEGLKVVIDKLDDQAKKILEAPVIIGNPRVEEVGMDYAVITWATDQESGSLVHYARETDFDPTRDEPYTTRAGDEGERVKAHSVRLEGLVSGTKYHTRVESVSDFGMTGLSRDVVFTTKDVTPAISNFRIVKVEADAVTLAWRTNIPASGNVEYTDTKSKIVQTAGSPVLATSHNVKISNLRLGTRYSAIVKAENALGDKVVSSPLYFTTVKDTAPPIISKVSSESTLYPTADAKVQTIVSWATDEPTYCQCFYRSGLNPNDAPTGLGEEKQSRVDHVQVVVDFLPATVYQFWVECRDPSNNKAKSENFVLFTPDKEKSIIDIILENFQGTFGWVKNIGK